MKKASLLATIIFLAVSCKIIYTGEFQPVSPPRNPTASLPERTFESYWQTFEDHYAFFELRNVDWHAAYDRYRPRVNSTTSDDSLFSILCQMVKPFQDEHINIIFPTKGEFMCQKPSRFLQEFPTEHLKKKFWGMVDQTLVKNEFKPLKSVGPKEDDEPLFHYTRSGSVGYIRFTRCIYAAKTEADAKHDAELAGKLLDSILEKLADTKRIILDVRLNEGGNDEFSYAIANRFTDKKVLGSIKHSRKGGYEEFGSLTNWYMEPKGKLYTNPVVVLTNDQSCSAADVFALIMKALPKTTLIGENTMGIFSDMYGFQLPNGWYASLSNERYYSAEMKCYEAIGTPVDVEIKNTKDDLVKMNDPVLEYALSDF